jgi:GNAT superfamily N-acetyltransferase
LVEGDPFLSRVEDAGLNASAPPEQRWLDGWLLRFSPGKARRARCINAVADGRLPLAERLHLAEAAYREAGLPLILRCTPFTRPPDLEANVAQRGWRAFDDTRVMLRRDLRPADPDRLAPQPVSGQDYAEIVGALRGSPVAQRQAHARRLLASPVPYEGFVVRDGDQVLACGQFAREADLVGLYDVFVAPDARGRGLARRLCAWLLDRALARGARHAYLQVEGDNHAARAVYHRLGFSDAYAYHYRTPESGEV